MNALAQGFYTTREAADLIEVGNLRRITSWLDGNPGSKCGPLLHRDYHAAEKGAPQELSFFDLIEVRFVEFFRNNGVKIQTMRQALEIAREKYGNRPFATKLIRFHISDDKKIYVHETDQPVASKSEEPKLWNLLKQQYEIVEALHQMIEGGVVFDASTELAKLWRPRPKSHPSIVVNPKIAYGKPTVESGVPTKYIFDTWVAEEENYGITSEWYGISPSEVKAAIKFEQELRPNQKR